MKPSVTPQDLENRKRIVNEIVARRDPALIKSGFEAYLRELPRLLEEKHEGHMVAYCGEMRAAIAPTERKLKQILAKGGFNERGKLFVTCVTALDKEEHEEIYR